MNNAKMWLVVKPTVGVPLFLSAVAIGSFAVHVAVLSKTNWYEDYLVGAELGSTAALETNSTVIPASLTGTDGAVVIEAAARTEDGLLVVLPDGRTARLVMQDDVASATPVLPAISN